MCAKRAYSSNWMLRVNCGLAASKLGTRISENTPHHQPEAWKSEQEQTRGACGSTRSNLTLAGTQGSSLWGEDQRLITA